MVTQFLLLFAAIFQSCTGASLGNFLRSLRLKGGHMPDFDEQYDSYAMWEHSGKFEGDIVLTELIERNGVINDNERWKNREIPYELDSIFDEFDAAWIRECLGEISRKTCLTVRPKLPEDVDYVHVISGDGCYSLIGRMGGRQELSLRRNLTGVGCLRSGTIIHEFLHAAGFFHQHSSPDRDQYIEIIGENVVEGKLVNFKKRDYTEVTTFDLPYDYGSVMHYGSYVFSKIPDVLQTIKTLDPTKRIGQRWHMSDIDAEKVNRMYCRN